MIKETFRYIEYSNEKSFSKHKHGKTELRKFTDDLVFAVSFDSTFDAIYSIGSKNPNRTGNTNTANFGAFGFEQHGILDGSIEYDEESFRILENEGSIKFWLRSTFNNAVGEQWFKEENPVEDIPIVADYGITIYRNGNPSSFTISLEPTDDGLSVYNKLAVQLIGNGFQCFRVDNRIRVTSSIYGEEIYITSPLDESINNLVELMGGVEKPFIANGPTSDIEFLRLSERDNNKNAISLTHDTNSHIILRMYDYRGDLELEEDLGVWSNQFQKWYPFELNWNEQSGQLFIGGKLNKIFMTGVERRNCKTYLTLKGTDQDNHHLLDELQIYNKPQHQKNYEPENYPLTPYDSQKPFLDIHFGQGFKESEVKDIIVTGSTNLKFVVKIGVTWYYYQNNSWRVSDGSFLQSTNLDIFEAKFADLFFNEKFNLIIRVYFDSDGWTPAVIDEVSIIREIGGQSSAYITGEIRLLDPVDLSDDNMILISTDQGSLEVDLTTSASDTSAVTLEEIKQAIRDAGVPGLASVSDDGHGRLVLVAETTGSSSFISVSDAGSNSALYLVWGGETSDFGEEDEFRGGVYVDYSELFRWTRSMLGAPIVPVELTDEQLEDCLSEAVWHYNRWRNFSERVVSTTLSGNPKTGWEIPAVVGGEENILELIMEPKYPVSYYLGRNDLMGNIFIQQLFNNANIMATAADYYIAMSASRDLNMILGTEVRWEVLNKRLFIYPRPSDALRVIIKYKSALTLDEIVTSQQIRELTLALAKIVLGGIRSTFGNQIPGGDGMLQLNGSELKAEGQQDRDRIIDDWKKGTNVYEFIIG